MKLLFAGSFFALTLQHSGALFVQSGRPLGSFEQRSATRLGLFFAEDEGSLKKKEAPILTTNDAKAMAPPVAVDLVASEKENFLNTVGSFLVDAFWLNSEHHQLGDTSTISPEARMDLIVEQCGDLQEKYGETIGKRLFSACAFAALDRESKQILGAATLKESLLMNGHILEPEKAEALAKSAVASLGPKQRRVYKDASISTIARELMSADTKAICVLANLAVSPEARGRGIAVNLCLEGEGLASDWGYDEVHLLVEKENTPARGLYEGKLGYRLVSEEVNTPALRANLASGGFTEVQVDTLVLAKAIQ